ELIRELTQPGISPLRFLILGAPIVGRAGGRWQSTGSFGGKVKRKRRTEITVESETIVCLRRRSRAALTAWCPQCAAEVKLVTPEEAEAHSGFSLRAIYRKVEADRLHFSETAEGQLFICLNSLNAPS